MPPTLDFRSFSTHNTFFKRFGESSENGEERAGDLTITTIVGITIGSLLFIVLVIAFLAVSRARRRKANAPISPEDEFAKASFARWQSNMAGQPPQQQQQSQQQRWPTNVPRRTTRTVYMSASASLPRMSTSTSSLSSDEKTWVDDEADLEVERRFYVPTHGVTGSGSRPSRSSRIDLPSALPRAHIPR